jgi:hypothetical protein
MITEHKFWFNTGVTPHNRSGETTLMDHQSWKGGTLQIAFYLESAPPAGATLAYLCSSLPPLSPNQVAINVVGGGMLSEFAVFNK